MNKHTLNSGKSRQFEIEIWQREFNNIKYAWSTHQTIIIHFNFKEQFPLYVGFTEDGQFFFFF